MIHLYNKNEPIDFITLSDALKEKDPLENAGGMEYLASLVDEVPTAAIIHLREDRKGKGREEEADRPLLRDLRRQLRDQARRTSSGRGRKQDLRDLRTQDPAGFFTIQKIVNDSFKIMQHLYDQDHITGVPSGFVDLDRMTAGFQRGTCHHRRPSLHGEDRLCPERRPVRRHSADNPVPVAIFSLEMSKEQLAMRLLCSEARIDASRMRTGNLVEGTGRSSPRGPKSLSKGNIFIDDTPGHLGDGDAGQGPAAQGRARMWGWWWSTTCSS